MLFAVSDPHAVHYTSASVLLYFVWLQISYAFCLASKQDVSEQLLAFALELMSADEKVTPRFACCFQFETFLCCRSPLLLEACLVKPRLLQDDTQGLRLPADVLMALQGQARI